MCSLEEINSVKLELLATDLSLVQKRVGWACILLPVLVYGLYKQLRQYNAQKQMRAYKVDPYYNP